MKHIHWLLFTVLCGLLLFMFMDSLAYLFPYHEQQQLFLFTNSYLEIYLSEPGKLGEYFANFVIQFFYLPYTGKIVLALILSCLYLLPVLTIRRLTGKNDPLQIALLPSLYLFIQFESPDFEISRITSLFSSFLITYLLSLLPRKAFCYTSIPCFLLTGFALGWIYPVVVFVILLLTVLSACMLPRLITSPKIYMSCTILCLIAYASYTFYSFVRTYNMRERLLIETEIHVKKQEWEQVLTCAKKYRGESQLMEYFCNMALYHTGRMPYDLLKYPQNYGINSLFLPWVSDPRQSRYGHYLYEQLGYINEAQRWASEALVVYGETAPTLLNLIRYNIANGRQEVAMRFIRILKQSLFYSKQAEKYERLAPTGEVPGLTPVPQQKGKKARFANIQNLGPELIFICEQDSTNRMAFEYLMSYLILSNRTKQFVEYLPRIKQFPYPEMPPLYQSILDNYKQTQQ
ncbi:MAG: hypothetical protein EGQ00_09925 [Parabacteroides johnsonii]|nr:hypothetical protein [Parabacteroides johnsonii]